MKKGLMIMKKRKGIDGEMRDKYGNKCKKGDKEWEEKDEKTHLTRNDDI
jgi:hypothetical protein